MKQTLKLVAIVLVAAVVAASCGGANKKEMLTKKWQWSEFSSPEMDKKIGEMKASLDTITDPSNKAMAEMSVKMADEMIAAMKQTTMEFKNDGKYEMKLKMMGQEQTETGSWSLSEDGKSLLLTDAKSNKVDTTGVDIAKDKVVMTMKMGSDEAKITMTPAAAEAAK